MLNDELRAPFATLLTPPGRGGIAVILLSGDGAGEIISNVFRPQTAQSEFTDGKLHLGHLVENGDVIDEAVVCRRSGTFEINVHGGPVVVTKTLELLATSGAEVIRSDQGPPAFETAHRRWNNPAVGREMLRTLPQVRSALVASAVSTQWSAGISELASGNPTPGQLRRAADGLRIMQRGLDPPEVVLAGAPNVGKSQLTNALVGRAVSIVHETPGTTRDWVRELAVIDGAPLWITDTAGLWNVSDSVHAEPVRRARKCIQTADLVVLLAAGEVPSPPDWLHAKKLVSVASKCDVARPRSDCVLAVSGLTGEGLGDLRKAILSELELDRLDPTAAMAFTTRQSDLLDAAADALERSEPQKARTALNQLLEG